jgi:hypothetical protein
MLGSIMELTEAERLLLVGKKEEIKHLTEELLDLGTNPEKNELEIKKKVTGILSLISTIASYSKSKNYDLDGITTMADMTYRMLGTKSHSIAKLMLESFCNTVNSIRFDFTKKGLKINIPKIDISIFRAK